MLPVSVNLPTKYCEFVITVYPAQKGLEPIVLSTPQIDKTKPVLVRIHDECITGDTFGSQKCDCGEQKDQSLKMIAESKSGGLLIYMRQEGRGIGLYEKIKAYKLQEEGYDTHEANIKLGHPPDQREYLIVKKILHDFGIEKVCLITNNPSKVSAISKLGVDVVKRVPLVINTNVHNERYFHTKKTKFKHYFDAHENHYFIGLNGIENVAQVEEIARFIKEQKKNPLVKIYLANKTLNVHSFSDEELLSQTEKIFTAVELFSDVVAVLHYSFKYSKQPIEDLKNIISRMSFVKYIQLDDLTSHFTETLRIATQYYSVIFPLTTSHFDLLLGHKDFVETIVNNKVSVLLDNSCGRGIREPSEHYKEKILKCLDHKINNIALAGGFSPDYLEPYFDMSNYFKFNLSIDAASGLQTNGAFDLEKAKNYIRLLCI